MDARVAALAPRLRRTLRGLLQGMQNVEIARDMGVELHTVENYVTDLLAEFGVSNRTALVVALRDVEPEDIHD